MLKSPRMQQKHKITKTSKIANVIKVYINLDSSNCWDVSDQFLPTSVATSDVFTSDMMFWEKFLMSDVLATNLMLNELLFLFSTFPVLSGWKEVRFIFFNFLSLVSHTVMCVWLSFQTRGGRRPESHFPTSLLFQNHWIRIRLWNFFKLRIRHLFKLQKPSMQPKFSSVFT